MAILYGILHYRVVFASDDLIAMDVWSSVVVTFAHRYCLNIVFLLQSFISIVSRINENITAFVCHYTYHYHIILLLLDISVFLPTSHSRIASV